MVQSTQNFLSLLPDDMAQGGLPSDFNGTVVLSCFEPYNYGGTTRDDGSTFKHDLFHHLTIEPDEDSGVKGPLEVYYRVGDLDHIAPSADGKNPVDLNGDNTALMRGGFVVPISSKGKVYQNSNFWFFIKKLLEAGYPAERVASGDIGSLTGLYAHWNRVDLPKRDIKDQPADKKNRDILVVTEVINVGAVAAKSAKAGAKVGAGKTGVPGANGAGSDLEQRAVDAILVKLAENEGQMAKKEVAPLMLKTFTGAERAQAVTMVGKPEFLEGHQDSFLFDADNGVLLAV